MVKTSRDFSGLLYVAVALSLVVVFALDWATPLGIAVWIFYFVPMGLTLFVDKPFVPILTAATGTALILASYFLSGNDLALTLHVIRMNRAMGVFTLWVVAFVAYRYIRTRLSVERMLWLQKGQMQVTKQMRGEQAPEAIGDQILAALVPFVDAQVGALYMLEDDMLERLATWGLPAGTPESTAPLRLRRGEGLSGEALAERRSMLLRDAPAGYLKIGSALGAAPPSSIIIAPLLAEGEAVGVIELGFFGNRPDFEDIRELTERAGENMGMALRSARYRMRLVELLEETQRQSEELQVQQEELRVSNEELEERGRALMDSQARLESQQTDLEQTNVQLEAYTRNLERQKAELLRAQQTLAANTLALERASQYKSEFLANMSHELRTPLNSSLILSKLLQDNKDGNLSAEQVRYAATIHASNNDLLSLINDILDLSKVEAGQMEMHFASASIDAVLKSMRQSFMPVAESKALRFVVGRGAEVPDYFVTDSQRLQQVLRNLLSNAFKFTKQGEVALEVRVAGAGAIRFDVRDTGIGIAPEKQELIFQAFQQADGTTSRKYGGSGLGLSISREFGRLLGGQVTVTSAAGEGSTFSITLPLGVREGAVTAKLDGADPAARVPGDASAHAGASLATPAASSSTSPSMSSSVPTPMTPLASGTEWGVEVADGFQLRPLPAASDADAAVNLAAPASISDDRAARQRPDRLILVIEDDTRFAQILYELAHELDFDCIHATTAADGVALARELQPNGILMDVGLPDQSGLTALEWLKHDPLTRHVPVHIVSASDHADVALQLGAIGYTLKPSARDTLADAIRKLESRATQGTRRVLVVEDDLALRQSIHALLRSEHVEIVEAGTLASAIEQMSQRSFDCVVMDLALPDGSSYELLERIAAHGEAASPPVIVYTGRVLSDNEEQRLRRYSKSIIIKGAKSPERLLDEVTLFLHSVEAGLPPEQQRMLRAARQRDDVFEERTILLAEDDVRNIFALSHVIEPLGAKLEIARNGREALEVLARRPDLDLVLMDVMMPEMDGLTAIGEIRKQPAHARLPIIALTAKAMASDRQRCLDAGADDYISKPIDVEKLISLCRVWLRQR